MEGGISLEMMQWKVASSRIEGSISCVFLRCGRKLGVPLELQQGPQGPTRKLKSPFKLQGASRESSSVGAGG